MREKFMNKFRDFKFFIYKTPDMRMRNKCRE